MSKYPIKKHRYKKGKRKVVPRFDRGVLTASDKKLLVDFAARRSQFEACLQEIASPFHTCPACAFPTLKTRGEYEWCILCDWEDSGIDDPHDLTGQGPPNYISLLEARVNMGHMFQGTHAQLTYLATAPASEIAQKITSYRQRLDAGETEIRKDFYENLETIFGSRV